MSFDSSRNNEENLKVVAVFSISSSVIVLNFEKSISQQEGTSAWLFVSHHTAEPAGALCKGAVALKASHWFLLYYS